MQKTGLDGALEAGLAVATERKSRLGAIKTSLQNSDEKTALKLMRDFLGLEEKADEQKAGYPTSTCIN